MRAGSTREASTAKQRASATTAGMSRAEQASKITDVMSGPVHARATSGRIPMQAALIHEANAPRVVVIGQNIEPSGRRRVRHMGGARLVQQGLRSELPEWAVGRPLAVLLLP